MGQWMVVLRRSSTLVGFFIMFPVRLRLIGLVVAIALAWFEQWEHRNANLGIASSTVRDDAILTRPIPGWIGALISGTFYRDQTALFRKTELIVTRNGYASMSSDARAPMHDVALTAIIIGSYLVQIVVLVTWHKVGLIIGIIALQLLYFLFRELPKFLLREPYPLAPGLQQKDKVSSYMSFLPQTRTPAFSQRSFLGRNTLYVDARAHQLLSTLDIVTLQTHEMGHIALGHTDTLFWVHFGQRLIVITLTLYVLLHWHHFLTPGNPLQALSLIGLLAVLAFPLAMQRLLRNKWESEANEWAERRVGHEAIAQLQNKISHQTYWR